jgi:hypothetical protein
LFVVLPKLFRTTWRCSKTRIAFYQSPFQSAHVTRFLRNSFLRSRQRHFSLNHRVWYIHMVFMWTPLNLPTRLLSICAVSSLRSPSEVQLKSIGLTSLQVVTKGMVQTEMFSTFTCFTCRSYVNAKVSCLLVVGLCWDPRYDGQKQWDAMQIQWGAAFLGWHFGICNVSCPIGCHKGKPSRQW